MILLIREFVAIKFLELAMFVAPKEMEMAIARGIYLTFPELAKQLTHQKEQGE